MNNPTERDQQIAREAAFKLHHFGRAPQNEGIILAAIQDANQQGNEDTARLRKALEQIREQRPIGKCTIPDCWPCKMWQIANDTLDAARGVQPAAKECPPWIREIGDLRRASEAIAAQQESAPARATSTPTTDFLARDGWSGDAVCVSWRDMARIETAFRTLIASVRHAHVDGEGLIRGCAVCTALANSERALDASSPSEQKSSLPECPACGLIHNPDKTKCSIHCFCCGHLGHAGDFYKSSCPSCGASWHHQGDISPLGFARSALASQSPSEHA